MGIETVRAGIGARLLQAQGLGVRIDGRWRVRGVDLAIRPGEIVTLIGPNGGGKTTTAKAILGIVPVDEGTLQRRPGLRIGYVPQSLRIDWSLPLTVARLMRLTGPQEPAAVAAALEEVGSGRLVDRPVAALSGGEFQRVLLARAIVGRPDLLVLDEPVQGVDYASEIALYEVIAAMRDRHGCAILMISHDLHIVMARTDTVVCLDGHVCCSGAPSAVGESPQYRSLFGERGARALGVYTHHHDHAHLPDGRVVALDPRSGAPVGDHHHHG
jgi:zinc transport system ATP-binding protein